MQYSESKTGAFYGYKSVTAFAVMTYALTSAMALLTVLIPVLITRLGISTTEVAFVNSCTAVASFLSATFLANRLYRLIGPHGCQFLFGICVFLYVGAVAFSPSVIPIYAASILAGVFMGCGNTSGISAFVASWFVDKRRQIDGYVRAVSSFGNSSGALIYALLVLKLGVEGSVKVMLLFFGALLLLSRLFVKTPEACGQQPLGYEAAAVSEHEAMPTLSGPERQQVLKTPVFYLYIAAILCGGMSSGLMSTLTIIGAGFGASRLSVAASLFTLSMALSVMGSGPIFSALGSRWGTVLFGGIKLAALILLMVWLRVGTYLLFLAAIIGVGVGTSGIMALPTMTYPDFFGMRSFRSMIPMVTAFYVLGSGLAAYTYTVPYDAFGTWSIGITISLVLTGACICLIHITSLLVKKDSR